MGASLSAGALLGEPGGGSFPGDPEEGSGMTLRGGPAGEPERGLVYRGLICKRRLWTQESRSIGTC